MSIFTVHVQKAKIEKEQLRISSNEVRLSNDEVRISEILIDKSKI